MNPQQDIQDKNSFSSTALDSPYVVEGILAKVFHTESSSYVYDTMSNDIYQVHTDTAALLETLSLPNAELRHQQITALIEEKGEVWVNKSLEKLAERAQDYNAPAPLPREFRVVVNDDIPEKMKNDSLVTLTLGITEQCNFRCGYCVYGGDYEDERPHGTQYMDLETGIKAIGYYLDHASNKQPPLISFYGGEPLLQRTSIETWMSYARTRHPKAAFRLTTNGYLLNPQTLAMLVRFNVNVNVSLDGPKLLHDQLRPLASGKGTFDNIMTNLVYAADNYPEYYNRQICFSATIADPNQLDEVMDFFRHHSLFKNNTLEVNSVRDSGSDPNKTRERINSTTAAAYDRYLGNLIEPTDANMKPETAFLGKFFGKFVNRSPTRLSGEFRPTGACPGNWNRLYVNRHGDFRVCEKTDRLPALGDLQNGSDERAIQKMEDNYNNAAKDCRNCFALRMCEVCHVYLYHGEEKNYEVDQNRWSKTCDNMRFKLEKTMTAFMTVLEQNPKAFDREIEFEADGNTFEPLPNDLQTAERERFLAESLAAKSMKKPLISESFNV